METREILRAEHLRKEYRKQAVLEDVSFTLEEGTATALMGTSGTGKTTLIRILAGLVYPEEGSLSLFGQTGESGLREARRQTGFLVDSAPVDKYRNVEGNLILRAELVNTSGETEDLGTVVHDGHVSSDTTVTETFRFFMPEDPENWVLRLTAYEDDITQGVVEEVPLPCGTAAATRNLPRWVSMMERQIARPMPMPFSLVV